MADHATPRTTQLYDRTDEITLDEVERIAICIISVLSKLRKEPQELSRSAILYGVG
jgi:hypothetical protein